MKPQVILCDIDGTIALHGPERGHYEYEKVGGDKPNEPVIFAMNAMIDNDGLSAPEVVFISGREDRCRHETLMWLHEHANVFEPPLLMRKTGDHRPDNIIKREIYDAEIKDKYDVVLVLDDRDRVVKMWRELGLTCLQVANDPEGEA
jgi:hypothetical protein